VKFPQDSVAPTPQKLLKSGLFSLSYSKYKGGVSYETQRIGYIHLEHLLFTNSRGPLVQFVFWDGGDGWQGKYRRKQDFYKGFIGMDQEFSKRGPSQRSE